MKRLIAFSGKLIFAILCISTSSLQAQDSASRLLNFYDKGVKAPATMFTGDVWLNNVVLAPDQLDLLVTTVTFEPGARTVWHMHPGGQALLVTEGKGYYQERGKPLRIISRGDVVKCPPGTEHWHGATPDSKLVHIAIVSQVSKGAAVLKEKITDEEYKNLK